MRSRPWKVLWWNLSETVPEDSSFSGEMEAEFSSPWRIFPDSRTVQTGHPRAPARARARPAPKNAAKPGPFRLARIFAGLAVQGSGSGCPGESPGVLGRTRESRENPGRIPDSPGACRQTDASADALGVDEAIGEELR